MSAALSRAGGRVVGLDGVQEQVGRYEGLGFRRAYLNVRMGGPVTPEVIASLRAQSDSQIGVMPYEVGFIHALERFEEVGPLFPAHRPNFLRAWLGSEGHYGAVAFKTGILSGYGVIRPTRRGAFRVGPLFAADARMASALLVCLLSQVPVGTTVLIDVPEPNEPAMTLMRSIGLAPVFDCVRMYAGAPPVLDLQRTFAITTCEFG
ncbi:acyl-CoA N-acyltransferase [Pavlovales sp. CCMP2436]|nr:acyl-CoA N-acyltransferase [Pavlovales sp. CCMP2436]|mmetsp:Transcript_45144/g.105657  ORF Transcript_45144/g.105657 Transcript_45144/m.105657 type:complete len:206 (-) Transcript_45144:187-804(-)